MHKRVLLLLLATVVSLPVGAQVQPEPLVTQPIDASKLVTLHGTVHPLAQARYDRGAVNESTPADRLLLLLNRPPEREAAFQQYLKGLNTPGSPNYHHWLTPQQIGSRFGPGDADINAVVTWLSGSGFRVNRVSTARRFVEFSGDVGQVNAAFHTQIHEYMVDGVLHHANATDVRIPQALAGIVAAVSPLHDFRPAPQFQEAGKGHYDASARQFVPDYNLPSSASPLLYGVVPADFYTQYDLNPLYSANVTGAGVTIGIIDDSNIDVDVANAYRSVFGLKANPVQVVVDGGDPGENSSDVESYLDVELAGAVAPNATIDLYVSAGSPYQDPLTLAAVRAIEDDQADVLSLSWGAGEAELRTSGNQFWNALWEQAAAQGQTVLVAAGDDGQLPDENYWFLGLYTGPAVNGIASTPWDIAAGGTDFYYADYASGAPSASTFWNATNDPVTKGSLKAPITEQVWSDLLGLNAIPSGVLPDSWGAGGGGASSCATLNSSNACAGGYAKPIWQTGPGVPADGVRDIPDISLFASNEANYSALVTCDYEGECAPDASGNFNMDLVGGTSAAAPAMAGIMALVDQKYGRQGQADAVLYPLAQQKPAAFHDITLGGNWDFCIQGDSDCTLNVAGQGPQAGESTVYSAGPGYDEASGLGSVDATQLVNNWNAISFASTSTTIQVSPLTAVHGTNVTATASVAPSSGSGTPTGGVALLTTSDLPSNESQTVIPLSNGTGTTTLNYLPGGTYQLTGRYGGDGIFAGSTSQPQTLTISPEKTTLTLGIEGEDGSSVNYLTYGIPVNLSAQPVGVNSPKGQSDGAATGSVAFTLDGATTSVPLNVGDLASWNAPALSVGTHSASASYSGDDSFQSSSAAAQTFSVAKGYPYIELTNSDDAGVIYVGNSVTISASVGPTYGPGFTGQSAALGLAAPTGTITIELSTSEGCYQNPAAPGSYAETVPLSSPSGVYSQYASAQATFPNIAAGQFSYYNMCAIYNGDANWESASMLYLPGNSVVAPPAPLTASTTTLTITPSSISENEPAALAVTVSGPAGATVAPTGYVTFFGSGVSPVWVNGWPLTAASSGASASFTLRYPASIFGTNGAAQITAVYSGDSNYSPSTSAVESVNVTQGGPDFQISPQAPQLSVASGSTASTGINLASTYGFSGTVALTCAPSSSQFSCSVGPTSTALSSTASATLTISATIPGAAANLAPARNPARRSWTGAGAALALCFIFAIPLRRRHWIGLACLPLLLAALCITGCGGGNGGGGTNPPPVNGTPAGTYTVLVTGTSNGIVHNAVIALVVH